MNSNMYIPFTYHIAWTEHNLHYYGVKFAEGCHPDDLWNPYKTSSKVVKALIESIGDPDIIEPRREFKTMDEAIKWEERVLKRLGVTKRDDWLNEWDGKAVDNRGKQNALGTTRNIEWKEKQAKILKKVWTNKKLRKKQSKIMKNVWAQDLERKKIYSDRMLGNQKTLGFKHTQESKDKMTLAQKGNKKGCGNQGNKRTDKQNKENSERMKEYWKTKRKNDEAN